MKVGSLLITLWVTAVVTFFFTFLFVTSQIGNINAPGELQEVLSAAGVSLFIGLVAVTGVITFIGSRKH